MSIARSLGVFLLLLAAGACGQERDSLALARASVAKGDLDHAARLLKELETPEARDLEAQIAKLRERHTRLVAQIDELYTRVGELSEGEARDQLKRWRDRETDAHARELLDLALSGHIERYRGIEAQLRKNAPRPALAEQSDRTREDDALALGLRSEVREALTAQNWQRANSALVLLSEIPSKRVSDVDELRRQLREGARAEAERLMAQARSLESQLSVEEAHTWLSRQAERFPPTRDFEALTQMVRQLGERARSVAAAGEGEFKVFELPDEAEAEGAATLSALGSAEPPADLDAAALVDLAREHAGRGELAYARSCALAASAKLFAGDLRDDCVGLSQDLRARLALREELARAWKSRAEDLGKLGVERIDVDAWRLGGAVRAWPEVGFELLQRAADVARVSPLAWRGVIAEALAGPHTQRESASQELARMVERGAIEAATASGMIARARGGIGASQRYLLAKGQWATLETAAASDSAAASANLERAFLRASGEARDQAFEALLAGAPPEVARAALAARATAVVTKLARSKTTEQLKGLANLRTALDAARKDALALIFDEETYFYPYNPPPAPKTAADYARAQRDVDEAVGKLREAWEKSKPVKLAKDFTQALEELEWCAGACAKLELPFALPETLPTWLLATPRGVESVDLQQFAWSEAEASDLALSRAVEARNERLWAALDKNKEREGAAKEQWADPPAREQVRVTNRYRAMFGRRSLAWNPRIQAAAWGHSKYMADTGDFGHFETDPTRRTPSDRAKLAGYNNGVSENCSMGRTDPASAHDGWAHSSGHHRNLLMAGHREMASSLVSLYWTQNFGADRAFEKELDNESGNTR
ncbi:MAG: hypothetical protein JNN27_22935 [Planctomycetes bacterium]|nr:hypothetical protein [Planctomycetota bacterium]